MLKLAEDSQGFHIMALLAGTGVIAFFARPSPVTRILHDRQLYLDELSLIFIPRDSFLVQRLLYMVLRVMTSPVQHMLIYKAETKWSMSEFIKEYPCYQKEAPTTRNLKAF